MKKHIAYIISAAAILFSAVSCDKLPENGKLDGMWQINLLTTLTVPNTIRSLTLNLKRYT